MRVVTIIARPPITIIDVSRGLQRGVVALASSLLSRIDVPSAVTAVSVPCNLRGPPCILHGKPSGAADASGCPFDRTQVREGTSGNEAGGMHCASGGEVDGVGSADREASGFHRSNAGPGSPHRRDRVGGGRSTPSLGSSLPDRGGTWSGCTNFNVIPATSSSLGVSRAHPWKGRRAAGLSPRRPRNDRTVGRRRTPAKAQSGVMADPRAARRGSWSSTTSRAST
jgi:hypothetical protein